jgi:DNA-binding winged helix-turn-helix (wHTH) protein
MGKDVFLDTDSSINGAVRKIRQALRDDPENPVFVQTVTGKGYRFIAAVTEAEVGIQEGGGKKLESSNSLARASTLAQPGPAPLATHSERRSPAQRPAPASRPRLLSALGILLLGVLSRP